MSLTFDHSCAAVTILPMRCGGGIKNKLLEAAAMTRPIVASPRAVRGLEFDHGAKPLLVCCTHRQWVDSISQLWPDVSLATDLPGEPIIGPAGITPGPVRRRT